MPPSQAIELIFSVCHRETLKMKLLKMAAKYQHLPEQIRLGTDLFPYSHSRSVFPKLCHMTALLYERSLPPENLQYSQNWSSHSSGGLDSLTVKGPSFPSQPLCHTCQSRTALLLIPLPFRIQKHPQLSVAAGQHVENVSSEVAIRWLVEPWDSPPQHLQYRHTS